MQTKLPDDFAAFILTHGRPRNISTLNSLASSGYTGRVYIVIDNEDATGDEYKALYGDKVIVFDKREIAKTFDQGDNFNERRTIIYARNACFEIAKQIGVKYFIQLDDDYTCFQYRLYNSLGYMKIHSLDSVLSVLLEYYKLIPAASIAMAQGGDFIGGKQSPHAKHLKPLRKCMNTFICSTDRPFQFVGRINEDVNTYVWRGSQGRLFFTIPIVSIVQKTTQKNKGGMSDVYLMSGTYLKSFYTVMYAPSCTKIRLIGDKHKRLHHCITWRNAVPVILCESVKKK